MYFLSRILFVSMFIVRFSCFSFACDGGDYEEAQTKRDTYFLESCRHWRISKGIESRYGYTPGKASAVNIKRLQEELGALSPEEKAIMRLIIKNFRISHSTGEKTFIDICMADQSLKSPRQRKREGMAVKSQHTSNKSNIDDSVFFTGGLGETASVKFIGSNVMTISTLFSDFLSKFPDKARNTMSAPHLSEFHAKRSNNPVYVYGVRLECRHYEDYTKMYTISGGKQLPQSFLSKLEEEVFMGHHIPFGLGYQFIKLHRLCAEQACIPKRDSVLKAISLIQDSTQQVQALGNIFSAFMPGEAHTEVQVPCVFPFFEECTFQLPYEQRMSLSFPQESEHQAKDIMNLTKLFQSMHIDSKEVHSYLEQKNWILSKFCFRDIVRKVLERSFSLTNTVRFFLSYPALKHWDQLYVLETALSIASKEAAKENAKEFPVVSALMGLTVALPGGIDVLTGPKIDHTLTSCRTIGNDLVDADNIHYALFYNHEELARFFIKAGSQIFDTHPDTALMLSAKGNNDLALKIIAQQNKKIQKNHLTQRAFITFVRKGNVKAIEQMCTLGFPVFEQIPCYSEQYAGCTALHIAAQGNREQMVTFLLERMCNKNIVNVNGQTAYDMLRKRNDKLQELLRPTQKTIPDLFSQVQHKTFSAVAVVRSDDGYYLMGSNRPAPSKPRQWRFPGGNIDPEDMNPIEAAAREAEEETGLPLRQMLDREEITANILHMHRSYYERKRGYEITFVEFLGVNRKKVLTHPSDDLDFVAWIPTGISEFEKWPVVKSNHFLMQLREADSQKGFQEVDKALEIENYGLYFLLKASADGDLERVKELVNSHVPYNSAKCSPLACAAQYKHREVIDFLWTLKGMDEQHYLLACGARLVGDDVLFQDLFQKAKFSDDSVLTLYFMALTRKSSDDLSLYLAQEICRRKCYEDYTAGTARMNIVVSPQMNRPIIDAIEHRRAAELKLFIESGAAFDFSGGQVDTSEDKFFIHENPLMACIRNDFVEGVQILLDKGMDPNCVSGFCRGKHGTLVSSYFNRYELSARSEKDPLQLMINMARRQQLQSTYLDNIPALFMAVVQGNLEIVKLLATHSKIDLHKVWQTSDIHNPDNQEVTLEQLLSGQVSFIRFSSMGFFGQEGIKQEIVDYLQGVLGAEPSAA